VSSIRDNVDIVDVFRPSEDVPGVVEDALKKEGIKVIWMQEGIYSSKAEKMAKERNIDVIYNRCIMAEHRRLFGDRIKLDIG
jgi:predicted CoA-binding protein